jgi:hypothetical protein
MNREYIEYYVKSRRFEVPDLQNMLTKASTHPNGEKQGLLEIAQWLKIPPIYPGCCITCGDILADFALKGGRPQWCCMHKPAESIYSVSKWEQRERRETCKDNARFYFRP